MNNDRRRFEFRKQFTSHKYNYIRVIVPDEDIYKMKGFLLKIAQAKVKEKQYQIDGEQLSRRWETGMVGERAVEIYLKRKLIDYNIGDSLFFARPDLRTIGLSIGVKTSWYGNHPLIPLNPDRPEIICIRNENTVYICGIAILPILRTFVSSDYVKDMNILHKRYPKSGFYGFHALVFFKDAEDIKKKFNYDSEIVSPVLDKGF